MKSIIKIKSSQISVSIVQSTSHNFNIFFFYTFKLSNQNVILWPDNEFWDTQFCIQLRLQKDPMELMLTRCSNLRN